MRGLTKLSVKDVMARLWLGPVPKSEFPELQYDEELLQQVKDACELVGTTLVSGFAHWGVRRQRDLDDPVDLLKKQHRMTYLDIGVLVLAWCKLVVPRLNGEWAPDGRSNEPAFTQSELYSLARPLITNTRVGHAERFRKSLSALTRLGYLTKNGAGTRKNGAEPLYTLGPAMDVFIDHHALWDRLAKTAFEEIYLGETDREVAVTTE